MSVEQPSVEASVLGAGAIASGATTGWGVATVFGNVGVTAGGTAFGVGTAPMIGAGAIAGAAAYGAYRGITDGDPVALGAAGLGTAAGVGVSAGIGGVGMVGSFGGIGLGVGAMGALGGVAGLGLYGFAKMLDSGSRESAFDAFSRMEERLDEDLTYSMAYTSALIELFLPEDDLLRKMLEYDTQADLQALKKEIGATEAYRRSLPAGTFGKPDAIAASSRGTASGQSSTEPTTWYKLQSLKPHQAAISDLVLHPHKPSLFVASEDNSMSEINLETGKRSYTFLSRTPPLSIAFHAQNNTLLAGDETGLLNSWSVESRQLIEILEPEKLRAGEARMVCAVAVGHQGRYWASAGSDRTITLWCKHELYRNRYRTRRQFRGHCDTVFSLTFTPDDRFLISASADSTLRIWDLQSWDAPRVLRGHQGSVNRAIVCPTHSLLVSTGQDAFLCFWDLRTGALLKKVAAHAEAIRFLAFSPDGTRLASSGNDGITRIWQIVDQQLEGADAGSAQREINLDLEAELTGCGPIAFDASGIILLMGDRTGKITLWHRGQG